MSPEPISIDNNIQEEPCELFNPHDKSTGLIYNLSAFTDARIQIKQKNLSGYYIKFRNSIHRINSNGRVENWPKGLFDLLDSQIFTLYDN